MRPKLYSVVFFPLRDRFQEEIDRCSFVNTENIHICRGNTLTKKKNKKTKKKENEEEEENPEIVVVVV